ncbi:protein-S-isoprenylcysteine O-methyltransferase [Angomonas deanei]|nr:protein-S-isoprenylcysteine O-methyltransferase [Angomonas deanei]|eukprot:EPY42656.1 protein-S-isoprenylcysteine O-methyltransferase [Angomonas deanei]
MLAGGASWYAYAVTDSVHWFTFGVYVIVVHVLFHMCEFCVAAVVRPREAHPDSFMIFHSVHYWIANGLALAEFFVEVFLIPDSMKLSKDSGLFSLLFRLNYTSCVCFALLTVIFYAVRVVAMIQGGSNFGLSIEDEKREEHTLVKHGVYKYLRHPAYFGWFWRTALAQLIIANPVNFVLHTLVTWYFFKRRIRYEEALLLKEDYFGDEYKLYIKKTIIGIPFLY